MANPELTGLEIVSGAVSGLPGPVQTSFFKAIGSLLGGLTAIPAAKLKQYAQGIEDTTSVRSAVAAVVAQAAANDAVKDPVLLQAATEIYLPTQLRKAKNRLCISQKTAEHIGEEAADAGQAAPPDDDWMNTFMRFAEDASSDQLQDLFGRILAGQIVRPSSFALATLRAVSELDKEVAADFSQVWAKSVGGSVDYGSEFNRGEGFALWKRLAEAGLMAPTEAAQFLPPFKAVVDDQALWSPMQVDGVYLVVHYPQGCGARWTYIDFTRVGRQIGSILARPDYEANIREAGKRLAHSGVTRVEMHSVGKPIEVIFAQAIIR